MSAPERGSLLVRETYDTKFLSVGSAVMTWIIVGIELNHLIEDRCLFFILYSLFLFRWFETLSDGGQTPSGVRVSCFWVFRG